MTDATIAAPQSEADARPAWGAVISMTFGVFGLVWCLFAWWWPAYTLGAWRDPLFIAWAVVFGISCLTDDTVETQAGATFFGLYYALLVFGRSVQRRAYSQLSIGG